MFNSIKRLVNIASEVDSLSDTVNETRALSGVLGLFGYVGGAVTLVNAIMTHVKVDKVRSVVARQSADIEAMEANVSRLMAQLADRDNTLGALRSTVENLKSTVENLKSTVEDLNNLPEARLERTRKANAEMRRAAAERIERLERDRELVELYDYRGNPIKK